MSVAPRTPLLSDNATDTEVYSRPLPLWRTPKFTLAIGIVATACIIAAVIAVVVVVTRPSNQPFTTPTLAEEITTENILNHLQNLENIAMNNNGSRTAITGFNDSVSYVLEQLANNTNYSVRVQYFTFPFFTENVPPQLWQVEPALLNFTFLTDFRNLRYGGSANNTAGFLFDAGGGCNMSEFNNLQPGQIVLISRGFLLDCLMTTKVSNAILAGAAGALVSYDPGTTGLFQAGLEQSVSIPVFSITYNMGVFLRLALSNGVALKMQMFANNSSPDTVTMNILADTPGGDEANTIVVGSHLDSVLAGPGINDNGSGSSTNLELAIQLAKLNLEITNKIRFAWWGAEEFGLIGSKFYVRNLTSDELDQIALNLNFDMLGSPNFYRAVYNGSSGAPNIRTGSAQIQATFADYFDSVNKSYDLTGFDGRSDYGEFIANGIPAGGVNTGAEVIKSVAQQANYGGIANAAFDPCYHLSCDTIDNINEDALSDMSQAAATVLQTFAQMENLRQFLNST